jgi:hypothetical protein
LIMVSPTPITKVRSIDFRFYSPVSSLIRVSRGLANNFYLSSFLLYRLITKSEYI